MLETISDFQGLNTSYNHRIYHRPLGEGKHFRRDTHNEWELLFFMRGNATYIIEGKHYKLRPYDLVIIRPSRYHYIQIDGNSDYERYNLYFQASTVGENLLHALPAELEVINCAKSEHICALFTKTDHYVQFGDAPFSELLVCLLRELFYNLLYEKESVAAPTAQVSPLVLQALDYINTHLYTVRDVREISSALFVTETYFFRVFKEQMHISPKKYITKKRLLAAERRISAGERPTEVYLQCGFHTYTAFYKRYVDFFGKAPSEH